MVHQFLKKDSKLPNYSQIVHPSPQRSFNFNRLSPPCGEVGVPHYIVLIEQISYLLAQMKDVFSNSYSLSQSHVKPEIGLTSPAVSRPIDQASISLHNLGCVGESCPV